VTRCLALGLAILLAVPRATLPATAEQELGRRFFLEARGQLPLIEDPAVVEYVRALCQKLVDTLGSQEFDYQVFVVAHPSLNAFAVPGGYLFLFSGLVARAATDDEIAGVLGHEIAHVHAHHILRQQTAGAVWTAAALAGLLLSAINPVLGAAGVAAAQTAMLQYSREFEQEADFLGLRITSEAGYDPHALGAFFKQLLVEQRLNPAGVPPYMLSHPVTEDRVAKVDSVIRAQKLRTPAGRPHTSLELEEVRAVTSAHNEPAAIVSARYEQAVAERPRDPTAHFLLGRVYQTIGKLEAARTALEEARTLGIGPRVDRPLGMVYLGLKQPALARTTLEAHLSRRPNDPFARLELGKAYSDAGDEAAALREFQRALRLDPSLDDAHRRLGLIFGRTGDQAQGFYHLAVAARLRGDLEQAYRHFLRTEELLPKDSRQREEVRGALEELEPLVRDRVRARRSDRRIRTGPQLPASSPKVPALR